MEQAGILIVEDEAIVALDIKKRVECLGYAVTGVVSSADAVFQRVIEKRPDLILMDIFIQGELDGVDTAEKIRRIFDIPIVFLTANNDEHNVGRAMSAEPYGFVLKPFDDIHLKLTIDLAVYRHEIDRRLRRREQKLSEIAFGLGEGVFVLNEMGEVTFANPEAKRLFGLREEEIIGRRVDEFITAQAPGAPLASGETHPSMRVFSTGRRHYEDNLIFRRNDGSTFPGSIISTPVTETGRVISSITVFRDTTRERKALEEMLRLKKLESLGMLAGGVAHDFNNLLTVIMGNISFVKMAFNPDDIINQQLTSAEEAAIQARNLTSQLLTFAQGGGAVKKIASIGQLIRNAVTFASSGSSHKPEFSVSVDLWPAEVDESQISHVIHSLVMNALEAMPDGGGIIVKAENMELEGDTAINLPAGRYIRISVSDSGPGIPAPDLERIFDPYFTTREGALSGAGFGLAICFSIIKAHDGIISVQSMPGHGTTFDVYLPAALEKIAAEGVSALNHGGAGRVLVMDDDVVIRSVAESMLTHFGYDVQTAGSGEEAISLYISAKEAGKTFDAVILDLTVRGGMGGLDTLKGLADIYPGVRAIVSSGYVRDEVMFDYRRYGFAGILPKPYSAADLIRTVRSVLEPRQ